MLKDRPCHVSIGVDTAEIWPHTKFAYAYRLPLRVIITALGTTIRRKVIASPRRTGREQARRSAPHSTPAQTLRGRVTPRNETRRWTLEPDSSHSIWRRICFFLFFSPRRFERAILETDMERGKTKKQNGRRRQPRATQPSGS